jgi:hypothetical protein
VVRARRHSPHLLHNSQRHYSRGGTLRKARVEEVPFRGCTTPAALFIPQLSLLHARTHSLHRAPAGGWQLFNKRLTFSPCCWAAFSYIIFYSLLLRSVSVCVCVCAVHVRRALSHIYFASAPRRETCPPDRVCQRGRERERGHRLSTPPWRVN